MQYFVFFCLAIVSFLESKLSRSEKFKPEKKFFTKPSKPNRHEEDFDDSSDYDDFLSCSHCQHTNSIAWLTKHGNCYYCKQPFNDKFIATLQGYEA